MEETFTYDDMNRLTGITLKRSSGQDLTCAVTYDALGRMTSRQAVTAVNLVPQVTQVLSQPVFDATKVHALASATTSSGVFPPTPQNITYTGFDKVSKVKQGTDSICYTYGFNQQRIYMEEHAGTNYWRTLVTGPYGVFAVVESRNGTDQFHYVLKDNLGSWTTITNATGTVEQQLSYDAWGNLRNPNSWANYRAGDTYDGPMFDRGYTGHEHVEAFGLINMNGRMYDPVMTSFLSVDRFVQNPLTAQGFNRYSYCMNNPLRFIDPTGWLPGGGGGNGEHPPGAPYYVDGMLTVNLPEVTIMPFNEESFEYTPNLNGGGGPPQWNNVYGGSSNGSSGCGGGSGRSINNGNNSPNRYMLSEYSQKYHHYTQTSSRGCKIAAARAYYQYFSGIDLGEAYFSTMANGMILVDRDTYLREFYEECGLLVTDGMGVGITEIGQELEKGHPFSVILKGEHVKEMTDMDHVVTMIGLQKKGSAPLLVYINDPIYQGVQVYQWVKFREDIKDAYFIIGLKNP